MNSGFSKKINRLICILLAFILTAGFIPTPVSADEKYDSYLIELEKYNSEKAAYDAYIRELARYEAQKAEWEEYDARLEQYNRYLQYLSDFDAYNTAVENYETALAAYFAYKQYADSFEKCSRRLEIVEAVINYTEGSNMYETLTGETVEAVLESEDMIAGYTVTSKQTVRDAGSATHALIEILQAYLEKDAIRDRYEHYKSNYDALKSNFAQLYSCLFELYKDNAVKFKIKQEQKDYRYCEFLCQLYTISLCLDDSTTVNKSWKISSAEGWLSYDQLGGYAGLEDTDLASPEEMIFPNEAPFAEYPEAPVMPTHVAEVFEPIAPGGTRPTTAPTPVADPGDPPSPPIPTTTNEIYEVEWHIGSSILVRRCEYMQFPNAPETPEQYLEGSERAFAVFAGWDKEVEPVNDNTVYTARFRADIFDLTEDENENVLLIPSEDVYKVVTERENLTIGISEIARIAADNGKDLLVEYENGVQIYFPNSLASEIINKQLHVLLITGNTVQDFELLSSERPAEDTSSEENVIFGGRIVFTDGDGKIVSLTGWQLRVPVENGNMAGLFGYSLDQGEKSYKLSQSGDYAVFVSDGSSEFKLVRKLSIRVETNGGGNVSFGDSEIKEKNVMKAEITPAIGYEIESVEVYYENEGEKIYVEFDPETQTFVMPQCDVVFSIKFRKIEYTVRFYVGSELYEKATYSYGDDLVLPKAPTKESDGDVTYVFVGWTPEISEKVHGSVDYTAKFNESTVADENYAKGNHGFNFPYMLFTIVVVFLGVTGTGVYFTIRLIKKKKSK